MSVYEGHGVTLYHGDCLDVLRSLPDASVDSVVTDPPYGLEFMGKDWDAPWKDPAAKFRKSTEADEGFRVTRGSLPDAYRAGLPFQQWCEAWATECLRVLKPGGMIAAFGGTRTFHRLACAIEDAGFEIRDSIAWLYGSGFPKSLDVSKAIDKAAGAEREVVGNTAATSGRTVGLGTSGGYHGDIVSGHCRDITAPATPAAEQWQGWGTALKPAFEPVVVARKPLTGTVAANVLAWGTGALNIDACRIEGEVPQVTQGLSSDPSSWEPRSERRLSNPHDGGRWPANVVLDESQAAALDEQSGESTSQGGSRTASRGATQGASNGGMQGGYNLGAGGDYQPYGDSGGASRFFYVAKAPTSERPRYKREGGSDNATTYGQMKKRECNVCGNRTCPAGGEQSGKPWPTCGHDDWSWVEQQSARDEFVAHPTVKPLDLMRWLVRLVTPPGGTVLEPFAGSGTTVEACIVEGFQCIAIEREADYLPLIRQRIDRRRDPVEALRGQAADLGLFDLLGGEGA